MGKRGRKRGAPYYMYPDRELENGVKKARMEDGLTAMRLSEIAYVCIDSVYNLENGYTAPYNESCGGIKPWVKRICDILKTTPEYLFPRDICTIKRKSLIESQASEITVGRYSTHSDPQEIMIGKEDGLFLQSAISKLPQRDQEISTMRFFNNDSLQDVGEVFGISRERVRQIEKSIIRRLRKILGEKP